MFQNIKQKFKNDPLFYYAMSIAATWAGVGSLMMGIEMAQKYGIVPFLLWALGNTLACIVFGIFAPRIPKLRDVFRSKPMRFIVGLMCPFQVWISMNGIQTIFTDTPLTVGFGTILAYTSAVFFIVLLWRFGMVRNVLTDNASWVAVYGVAFCLTVAAIIHSRGNMVALSWGLNFESLSIGLNKCLLLIPGAFLYPYFFEILDYNEQNTDGTCKIDISKAFVLGGVLFGAYLAFTFLLSWARFSPLLNTVKAFLIVLIAVSSLSSFQYSIYITFGRRLGLAVNIAAVALWQYLVPLGVMGVWTLMSEIRLWIVVAGVATAFLWDAFDKGKAVTV